MWKFKLVHYPRFKRRCSDRDGNTRSKSKAGRSGKGSCTDCRTVLYASPNHKLENFNERYRLFSPIIYENWCCGPVISPVRFASSQRKKADGMDIPIGNPSRQKRLIVGGTCFSSEMIIGKRINVMNKTAAAMSTVVELFE